MASGKHDRVAKRYARALFDVSAPSDFDRVAAQLSFVAAAWQQSPDFRQSMLNPRVGDSLRLELVDALLASQGGWATPALQRTVHTIVTLRKSAVLPAIAQAFASLVSAYRKSLALEVTVASAITDEMVAGVKQKLSAALGGDVTVTVKNDPALLGGITIRLGDTLLDRSVAGTLQRVASQLV
jgi:F-type H+-transporting ATPase subunit delta